MIQWVVEAAESSGIADRVLVATPDEEIAFACRIFGAQVVLTRNDHATGTDRITEVAESFDAEIYVNVQGDEPLIRPETIRTCAEPLLNDSAIQMGSVYGICSDADLANPAVVKVVTDLNSFALYFSRHPIPYPRNEPAGEYKKHVGIYAYRRETLRAFAGWPVSPLERAESLEQLRFLEHGVSVKMSRGTETELAVDTPEQAVEVRRILEGRQVN